MSTTTHSTAALDFRSTSAEPLRERLDGPGRTSIAARLALARSGDATDMNRIVTRDTRRVSTRDAFAANLLAARLGIESPVALPYDDPLPERRRGDPVQFRRLGSRPADHAWRQVMRWGPGTSAQLDQCWELICRGINYWLLVPAMSPRAAAEAIGRSRPTVLATIGRRHIHSDAYDLDGYLVLYPSSANLGLWTASGVLAMTGTLRADRRGIELQLKTARSFGPLLHELVAHDKGGAWAIERVTATASGAPGSASEPTPVELERRRR